MSGFLLQLGEVLKPIALQIDLATAAIALIAFVFSVWSFYNQRRVTIETLRVQRDNDIIQWSNRAIEVLVGIEFLLRNWSRHLQTEPFQVRRDGYLASLSTLMDQGRLYFPKFERDIIDPATAPPVADNSPYILDRLVLIYDLVKDLDPRNSQEMLRAMPTLLLRKRGFIAHVQQEVDPQRRLRFLRG